MHVKVFFHLFASLFRRSSFAGLFLCLIFTFSFVSEGFSQRVLTNKGIDFWFGYMNNNIVTDADNPLQLGMFMSFGTADPTKTSTKVKVAVPGLRFEDEVLLPANQVVEYRFDKDPDAIRAGVRDYLEKVRSNLIQDLGVNVKADDSINLSLTNRRNFTYDVTGVYHSGVIGTNYVVGAYGENFADGSPSKTVFMIVAKNENTRIRIVPTAAIINDDVPANRRQPNRPFEITLNGGQAYHAMSNGDLTGTTIDVIPNADGSIPCTPFAVFGGNQCTNVGAQPSCDHLVEQMLPLPKRDYEGSQERSMEFIIYGTNLRPYDVCRVIALTDTLTNITVHTFPNQTNLTLSGKGKFADFDVESMGNAGAIYMESDRPVALYMMVLSDNSDGTPDNNADPAMVTVPPIEMMQRDTGFVLIPRFQDDPKVWTHSVNVFAKKNDPIFITRRGGTPEDIRTSIYYIRSANVRGNPDYVVHLLAFNSTNNVGSYMLTCAEGMMTYSYGIAYDDSYSYVSNLSFVATPNLETRIKTRADNPCEDEAQGAVSFQGIGGEPFEYMENGREKYFYAVKLTKQNPAGPDDTIHVNKLKTYDPTDYTKFINIGDIRGTVTVQGGAVRPARDTVMHFFGLNKIDLIATVSQYRGCEVTYRFSIGALPPLRMKVADTICRAAERAFIVDSVSANTVWWCTDPPGINVESETKNGLLKYFVKLDQPQIQDTTREYVDLSAFRKRLSGQGTFGDCNDLAACIKTQRLYFTKPPRAVIDLQTIPGRVSGDTLYLPDPTGTFRAEVKVDSMSKGFITPPDDSLRKHMNIHWDFGNPSVLNDTSVQQPGSYTYPEDNKLGEIKAYDVTLRVSEKGAPGCSTTVNKRVYVSIPRDFMIAVPNVFTPNGDGTNDRFQVENKGIVKFEIVIYDRWGMEVYRGNDIANGWDGKVQGKDPAAEGQYFWVITARTVTDLDITRTGSITLLR